MGAVGGVAALHSSYGAARRSCIGKFRFFGGHHYPFCITIFRMNASPKRQSPISTPSITRAEMERAFYSKDTSYDGLFFVAVKTTGIFCRPSCPANPKRENVEFFRTIREAL